MLLHSGTLALAPAQHTRSVPPVAAAQAGSVHRIRSIPRILGTPTVRPPGPAARRQAPDDLRGQVRDDLRDLAPDDLRDLARVVLRRKVAAPLTVAQAAARVPAHRSARTNAARPLSKRSQLAPSRYHHRSW